MYNQGKANSWSKNNSSVSTASNFAGASGSLQVETDIAMVLHLADGTISACNARAEEILGLTVEQIHGWTCLNCPWQTIHEDGSPFSGETHPAIMSLKTGQPCLNTVMGLYQPSGNLVWLNINSHPLFQFNTSIPYAVVTTFSEIPAIEKSVFEENIQLEAPHKEYQKAAEAEIQRLNQELERRVHEMQTILDAVPVGIAIAEDASCQVIRANGFAQSMLTVTPDANVSATGEQAEILPFRQLRDGKDISGEELPMQLAASTGATVRDVEIQMVRSDGAFFDWWVNAAPLFDEQGAVRGCVAAFMDITELKQTQKFLRINEERLRIAQIAAKAGTWDWDVVNNSVYWSKEYYTLYGLDAATPSTYENWLAIVVEEDREFVERSIFQALEEKATSLTFEFRINHPVEGVKWFDSRSQIFYNHDGQPVRLIGISIDISEHKRTEEELLQKNAILNLINESAPIPIFVKDRQGRIIYANPATLEVLGKSEKEVIGLRDCDWYPSRELGAIVTENDLRIMESGQTSVVEESPDGIRTFLGMKAPYRNEAGEVIGLIGISNDITARVQHERDRERILQLEQAAREESERANRIKDEFLAILSHELRTPLNPILGWSKLLQSGKLNAAKTTEALKTIERNAKLQLQLIEDLLDISRIIQGKFALNIAPTTLKPVIGAALDTVKLAAEAKNINIQTIFEPDVGQVLGDTGRLQQVVWNLVSNAIKFTPESGRVEVLLTQIENFAQIQVIDTGKGISPEFLPYVFEHFCQEDGTTTRQFGGLGLGLAIVRQLVDLHDGIVIAESAGEGKGATFTVRLPLVEPVTIPVNNSNDDLHCPKDSEPLAGLKIIIIDDEIDSRDFIAFALEQAGAEVTSMSSATEAFKILQQVKPNLIVSDIGMPEMDGYTLIKQIRTQLSTVYQHVPAIALTAFAGEVNERQALKAGFQKHLAKPVDVHELINTITCLVINSGA